MWRLAHLECLPFVCPPWFSEFSLLAQQGTNFTIPHVTNHLGKRSYPWSNITTASQKSKRGHINNLSWPDPNFQVPTIMPLFCAAADLYHSILPCPPR
jgi:hypothetical protein